MKTRAVIVPDITNINILWSNNDGVIKPYIVNGIEISLKGNIYIILNDETEEYLIDICEINKSFFEKEEDAIQAEINKHSLKLRSLRVIKNISEFMLDLLYPPKCSYEHKINKQ